MNNGTLTDAEIDLVRKYLSKSKATSDRTFSIDRKIYIACGLVALRKHMKSTYCAAVTDEVYDAIGALKDAIQPNGRHYKANTLNGYIKAIRSFLLWLNEKNLTKMDYKEIAIIKAVKMKRITKKSSDILTDEEISRLINACRCDRDRALISLLYHSAGRISEVLSAKWSQISVDIENGVLKGCEFMLEGTKTAESADETKERTLYLPLTTSQLLNIHKSNSKPADGDYIFKIADGSKLEYDAAAKLIARIGQRAGLKVHAHLLRTSRITNWVKEGYPETVICLAAWGTTTSQMWQTYVILAGGYAAKAMKIKINGESGPAAIEVIKKPDTVKCWHCRNDIPGYSVFCPICGKKPDGSDKKDEKSESEQIKAIRAEYDAKIDNIMAEVRQMFANRPN